IYRGSNPKDTPSGGEVNSQDGAVMFQAAPVPLRAESRSLGRGSLLESGHPLTQVVKLLFVGQRTLGKRIQHAFDIFPIMRNGVGDPGKLHLGHVGGFHFGNVRLNGGQPGVAPGGKPEQFIESVLKLRIVHTMPFSLHRTNNGVSQRRMARWGQPRSSIVGQALSPANRSLSRGDRLLRQNLPYCFLTWAGAAAGLSTLASGLASTFTAGLTFGLLFGFDSGFETLGSSRPIGMGTGDGRSTGGAGRGAGGITRGGEWGADGTGGVGDGLGAGGGVGPGFDGMPGCPGSVIGDCLGGGMVVVPPLGMRVGAGAVVAGVPFEPCELGLRRA